MAECGDADPAVMVDRYVARYREVVSPAVSSDARR